MQRTVLRCPDGLDMDRVDVITLAALPAWLQIFSHKHVGLRVRRILTA